MTVTNSGGTTTSSNAVRVNFDDGATAAPTAVLAGPSGQTIGYSTSTGAVLSLVTIADSATNNATLKYQWYKAISGATTVGSTLLEGETASTLSPDTSAEGMFYYYVVVSNSKAPAGIASNIVTITVGATAAPSGVSVTPGDAQEVMVEDPTTMLTVNVSNTGGAAPSSMTYQWYSRATNSNAIVGATVISGATSTTFHPPFDTAGVLYYFCVATNAAGSTASNTVKVEVRVPIPPVGGTVTIDNIEWRVLATDTTTPGGPYHLITTERAVAGTSIYNSGSDYIAYADQTTGGVRAAVNNWYAARGDELKSRAYMPNTLASETAYHTYQAEAVTAPGAKADAVTVDVAFLLSYSEVSIYMPTATNRILRSIFDDIAVPWWLRSPGGTATHAGSITTNGNFSNSEVINAHRPRPALWIR